MDRILTTCHHPSAQPRYEWTDITQAFESDETDYDGRGNMKYSRMYSNTGHVQNDSLVIQRS